MSKSEINFEVELDENDFPESIAWNATNKPGDKESTQAVSIAVWDPTEKETMRIDLWTKDMPRDEMRGFYINALAGMAESVEAATGDAEMAKAMIELCERFCK
jgi:gliding motility-associated protein GldC